MSRKNVDIIKEYLPGIKTGKKYINNQIVDNTICATSGIFYFEIATYENKCQTYISVFHEEKMLRLTKTKVNSFDDACKLIKDFLEKQKKSINETLGDT